MSVHVDRNLLDPDENLILIADDDADVRQLLSEVFAAYNIRTMTAYDGYDAWNQIRKSDQKPDIVITDFFMPRMNGIELLNAVKEMDESIKVFLISGCADWNTLMAQSEYQPDGRLDKPFSVLDLFQLMGYSSLPQPVARSTKSSAASLT